MGKKERLAQNALEVEKRTNVRDNRHGSGLQVGFCRFIVWLWRPSFMAVINTR
jgi:hypothetical protein